MQNTQVSFKSNIRFTNLNGFKRVVRDFPISVDRPWTAKEIIRAPYAWTAGVKDCTAGGILVGKDRKNITDVVMFHISPSDKDNSDFEIIKRAIMDKIGSDKPIQGFLLGGKKICQGSVEMFDNFEKLMKELKIPKTKFKGLPVGGHSAHIAYNAGRDEWVVAATAIEDINKKVFAKTDLQSEIFSKFQKVVISKYDKLIVE